MGYFVYLLYNKKHDKFYIGQSNSLERRIFEHNFGLSNYTSKYDGTWEKVYSERFDDRKEALIRERFLKKQKSKKFYKKLCNMN